MHVVWRGVSDAGVGVYVDVGVVGVTVDVGVVTAFLFCVFLMLVVSMVVMALVVTTVTSISPPSTA